MNRSNECLTLKVEDLRDHDDFFMSKEAAELVRANDKCFATGEMPAASKLCRLWTL